MVNLATEAGRWREEGMKRERGERCGVVWGSGHSQCQAEKDGSVGEV